MDNKVRPEWFKEITVEDMPTPIMQEIAAFDMSAAIMLLENFCGCNIYIPNDGFKTLENKYILKNYDGSTAALRKLAVLTNRSEQHIRNVLKRKLSDVPPVEQTQLDVFGVDK